jgi:hypothetical protein
MIGIDPECFIVDTKENLLPASRFVPNVKKSAVQIGAGRYGYDNASLEFNPTAGSCLEGILYRMNTLMRTAKTQIRKKTKRFAFKYTPIIEIDPEIVYEHESLVEFGCDPSLRVSPSNKIERYAPANDPSIPLRSTGFHIHIGKYDNDLQQSPGMRQLENFLCTPGQQIRLVKMLDLMVGLPSVMMYPSEMDAVRRQFLGYGVAGEFRVQPHGIEYRTLSGWPLEHPEYVWMLCSMARDAYFMVRDQIYLFDEIDMPAVAETINTANVKQAKELWKEVQNILKTFVPKSHMEGPNYSRTVYFSKAGRRLLNKACKTGISSLNLIYQGWKSSKINPVGLHTSAQIRNA